MYLTWFLDGSPVRRECLSGKLDFFMAIDDNIYYWAGSSVGERLLDTQKVVSSILIPPTSEIKPFGKQMKAS